MVSNQCFFVAISMVLDNHIFCIFGENFDGFKPMIFLAISMVLNNHIFWFFGCQKGWFETNIFGCNLDGFWNHLICPFRKNLLVWTNILGKINQPNWMVFLEASKTNDFVGFFDQNHWFGSNLTTQWMWVFVDPFQCVSYDPQ